MTTRLKKARKQRNAEYFTQKYQQSEQYFGKNSYEEIRGVFMTLPVLHERAKTAKSQKREQYHITLRISKCGSDGRDSACNFRKQEKKAALSARMRGICV